MFVVKPLFVLSDMHRYYKCPKRLVSVGFSFSPNVSSQGFPVEQYQPQLRRIFHVQTLLAGYFWVRGLDTRTLSRIASLQTASPSSSAVSIVFNISLSLMPSGQQILRTLLPPAESQCPRFLCHDNVLCRLCHSTASSQKDDSFLSAFALVSL